MNRRGRICLGNSARLCPLVLSPTIALGDSKIPGAAQASARAHPRVSVVCPTLNERENIARLVRELSSALSEVDHQIVIVDDDSPDGTLQLARQFAAGDGRVRAIAHEGERSLSASVINGFTAAAGEIIACMDADLQHDPAILPHMLEAIEAGAQIAIGCRYMPGGGTADWSRLRRLQSRFATLLCRLFLGVRLRDPLSGYFMLRRDDFLRIHHRLDGRGFKILLEVMAHLRPQNVVEVPYTFRRRLAGRSKLTARVAWYYLAQLFRLWKLGSMPPPLRVRQ